MKKSTTYPRWIVVLIWVMLQGYVSAQPGQIVVNRVELMPNEPSPYQMRDWLTVAQKYDTFIYDLQKTGTHLPLIFVEPSGINYPAQMTFGLHSYVGTMNPNAGEAINVLPSLVGASLCGIDKTDQMGRNWILMSQDYFNKLNGELIYLNNRGGGSGSDWWYDMMPNIYFCQLYDLYGEIGDAQFQFEIVASRFAQAVRAMGGSDTPWTRATMNYRAWDFVAMEPNEDGVPEPEAAGAFAWVLYHAYKRLQDPEYLKAAEWSIEFLNTLGTNPSYELQLPYGAYIAAKMNAELNTEYNIEKLVYWVFNRGPLRGWGTIVGEWGGVDASGLVGEANDQGNDYAFQMNGVQQAGALVPMVRYDKRFCRAIGKWVLNVANATRLMFPGFLPAAQQDASDWSSTYDPDAVIGYEALREHLNGYSPFATGDAVNGGWAATNLALYGTSSIGYLGSMISTTNQEKILLIDLLKTDFFRDAAYPSYLLYNPYPGERNVILHVGDEMVDIYDALSETYLEQGISGEVTISVPADQARSLVYVPSGGMTTYRDNRLLVDGVVIDYMQNAVAYNVAPRIQALAVENTEVAFGDTAMVFGAAIDPETKDLTYHWSSTGGDFYGEGEQVGWIAPEMADVFDVTLTVFDDDGNSDTATISLNTVAEVNIVPEILALSTAKKHVEPGAAIPVICVASDQNGDSLTFEWFATGGTIQGSGSEVSWESPLATGIYTIRVVVRDVHDAAVQQEIRLLVYDFPATGGNLIAHYPFDGDARDISGNDLHGTVSGPKLTEDRFGNASSAYFFDGINDHISVSNAPVLNFDEAISVSCWIRPLLLPDRETFIISHGSWQNRWKISVIPDRNVRWTVNTADGPIGDLDSESVLQTDSVYHICATYDKNFMLLFVDGRLESFRQLTGAIRQTDVDLEIGQMLPDVQTYNFRGEIDDIRIHDYGLHPDTVLSLSGNTTSGVTAQLGSSHIMLFPNPVRRDLMLDTGDAFAGSLRITIYDHLGRMVRTMALSGGGRVTMPTDQLVPGLYFVNIRSDSVRKTIPFIKLE